MIVRKSISDQVFDYLVQEIKEGRLRPGDKLDTERDLSEKLGVSRVPIREAIRSLSRMGILTTRHGEGTYVNSKNPDVLSKAMNIYMLLDETLVIEFMEVRKIMESEAAKLACENATDEDIEKIMAIHQKRQDLVNEGPDNYNYELLYEYDSEFHFAIAEATHNSVFVNFLDAIHRTLKIQQQEASKQLDMPERSNKFHGEVIKAIVARDGEKAAALMSKHLDEVTKSIVNHTK